VREGEKGRLRRRRVCGGCGEEECVEGEEEIVAKEKSVQRMLDNKENRKKKVAVAARSKIPSFGVQGI